MTNFCQLIEQGLAVCQNPYLEPQCVDGYVVCRSPCKAGPDYCSGHGVCSQAVGQPAVCSCQHTAEAWYPGERCDGYVSRTWLIVGVCLGTLALVALVSVCFLRRRTARNKKKDSYITNMDEGAFQMSERLDQEVCTVHQKGGRVVDFSFQFGVSYTSQT